MSTFFQLLATTAATVVLLSSTDALNLNGEPSFSRRRPGQIHPNESSASRTARPSQVKKFEFGHADQLASEPGKATGSRAKKKDAFATDRLVRRQLDDLAAEDDDDDMRIYVGTSLGENMKRDYVIDPHGYEMGDHNEFRPPQLRYYKMLGLTMAASLDVIKRSYRRLAKLYHPGRYRIISNYWLFPDA
jgi:hypothetical protein